ncbi:hypothetical protein LJC49_05830 [Ruminococcaceae bacterium OttesenSCG-928-I18]|nr:hypothetical protein [Ruminococcaceae bacterium OttesenSCG-928-I18]
MKKRTKIIAAALLACFVFLSACGGQPSQEEGQQADAKGRYIEKDITPGEGSARFALFRAADGTLVCFDEGYKNRYESRDGGESWEKTPGPGAGDERFERVWNTALLEDGSLLAELQGEPDENGAVPPSEIVKISPDGTVEPVVIEGFSDLVAEGQSVFVTAMQALPGGKLLLGYDYGYGGGASSEEDASLPSDSTAASEPQASTEPGQEESQEEEEIHYGGNPQAGLYDLATGKRLADLSEEMELAATADEETLYLLGYDGSLSARKLEEAGTAINVDGSFPLDEMTMRVGLCKGPDGQLYFADNKALLGLEEGSAAPEEKMDGASYSFGAPNTAIEKLVVLEDGSFLMNLTGPDGAHLVKYTWDPDAQIDPANTLSVWMLRDNPVLRASISTFVSKHPEAAVDVEVALGEEGGMTAEDAIKALNTRMLAGEGPDILLLDGCPAAQYANNGMLANLQGAVDTSAMEEGLRSSFEAEGETHFLPMRWQPPVLLGQQEDLENADNLNALLDLVRQGSARPLLDAESEDIFSELSEGERPVLSFDSLREVHELLWNSGAPALIKENKIQKEVLRSYLEAMKTLSDKDDLASFGEEGRPDGGLMGMSTNGADMVSIKGSPLRYVTGQAEYAAFTAEDTQILFFMDEAPGTKAALFPGLAPGSWLPSCLLGINADSSKQELATAFLQNALDLESQSKRVGGGFPVTGEGLQQQMEDITQMMADFASERDEEPKPPAFDFDAVLAGVGAPVLEGEALKEILYEAAKAYCEGSLDLTQAMAQVEKETAGALAERQN